MAQEQPADVPSWAEEPDVGDAGVLEPSAGKIDRGFYHAEAPPPGWVNWLFWLFARWLRHLNYRVRSAGASLALMQWTAIASTTGYGPAAFGTRFDVVALGTTWKYSGDGGLNWATTTPAGGATASHFKAIACNDTVFVAVGTVGKIQTSPCGVTPSWTARTAGSSFSGDFRDVIWSGAHGLFVAIGDAEVQTSPDGVTWTRRVSALPISGPYTMERFTRIMQAGGRFVRVGSSHDGMSTTYAEFWYSDDAITWTRGTSLEISELPILTGNCAAGVFPDGTTGFCAGFENGLATSVDGASWGLVGGWGMDLNDFSSCVFHDGMLYAFSDVGVAISHDASNWRFVPIFESSPLSGWAVSGPHGYALATSGGSMVRSAYTKPF